MIHESWIHLIRHRADCRFIALPLLLLPSLVAKRRRDSWRKRERGLFRESPHPASRLVTNTGRNQVTARRWPLRSACGWDCDACTRTALCEKHTLMWKTVKSDSGIKMVLHSWQSRLHTSPGARVGSQARSDHSPADDVRRTQQGLRQEMQMEESTKGVDSCLRMRRAAQDAMQCGM